MWRNILKNTVVKLFNKRIRSSHLRAFIYSNNWTRFRNFCHIEIDKRLGKIRISGFPYVLFIDSTNFCNLKCPFCPTGKGKYGREKGIMSFNKYKEIIDKLGKYLYLVCLYNWGEPLLNKEIDKFVGYTSKKGIYTVISSNLTILSEEIATNLIKSRLNCLIISLDGASPETYSQYKKGGDFNKIIQNIELLNTKKKELKSNLPHTIWQFVVFKHNEHEIEIARTLSRKLGINEFNAIPAYIEDESWRATGKKYRTSTSLFPIIQKCGRLWTHIAIHCDGGVSPCCWSYYKKDDFGNIFEEDFDIIWNNEKFRVSREIVRGKVTNPRINTICYTCAKTNKPPLIK